MSLLINHFDSYGQYYGFALAREFRYRDSEEIFVYPKNIAELTGGALAFALLKPADLLILKIRSPLVVLSAVIIGIVATTILFYPTQSIALALYIFPPLVKVGPKVLRFGMYALFQATILGLGMRTFGRLCNPTLMTEWEKRREVDNLRLLTSTPLGSEVLK